MNDETTGSGDKRSKGRKPRKPRLRIVEGGAKVVPLRRGQGHNEHGLTAKQEAFAQGVANGGTLAASYRAAYDAEGMAPATVWTKASELMASGKVADRVAALCEAKQVETKHDAARTRLFVLERLHHEATTAASPGARVRALELLGKVDCVGMFRDRVTTEDEPAQDVEALASELEARIARLLSA